MFVAILLASKSLKGFVTRDLVTIDHRRLLASDLCFEDVLTPHEDRADKSNKPCFKMSLSGPVSLAQS